MPIEKFRSLDAIHQAVRIRTGTEEHSRALRSVFWMARLSPEQRFPPGVYKYRSLEEAQAQRQSWSRRR